MIEQTPESILIGFSTCPDEATAALISTTLVTEGLAACVNRIPGVHSTYFWDGGLQEDAEILLIIKTTAGRLPSLEARLKALHPYQIPELIMMHAAGGNEPYLNWVRMCVARKDERKE